MRTSIAWMVLVFLANTGCRPSDTSQGRVTAIAVRRDFAEREAFLISEKDDAWQGEHAFNFTLTNSSTSNAKLNIQGKSCSCLRIELDGTTPETEKECSIHPGDTASCKIVMPLQTAEGVQSASAVIAATYHNDRKEVFGVAGDVAFYEDVITDPVRFDLEPENCRDERIDVKCRYRVNEASQLDVQASTPQEWLKINKVSGPHSERVLDTGIAEATWSVDFTCDPVRALRGMKSSRVNGGIRLTTIDSEVVRGGIMAPVTVTRSTGLIVPNTIYFGRVSVGRTYRRSVPIRSVEETPFTVESASSDCDEITASVRPHRHEDTMKWITIVYKPSRSQKMEARVVVKTDYADHSIITFKTKADPTP